MQIYQEGKGCDVHLAELVFAVPDHLKRTHKPQPPGDKVQWL